MSRPLRDDAGRYDVSFERACVCGHKKGHHTAGAKMRSAGECIAHELGGATEPCPCMKFRAARKGGKS